MTRPLPTTPWTLTRAEVDRILAAVRAGDLDAIAVVRILLDGPHHPSLWPVVDVLLQVLDTRES